MWHSNDKYRKVIWQCNKKFQNAEKCSTPHINEKDIKSGFVKAYISMMDIRQNTIADSEILLEIVTDFTELNTKSKKLKDEIEVISELVKKAVSDNATATQSQEQHNRHYTELTNRYEKASAKLQKVTDEITFKTLRATELKNFIETLKTAPSEVLEFDERLWFAIIESVTVMPDGKLIYKFKNNQEIVI